MKLKILTLALILLGLTTQNLDSWDQNWSNQAFNSSTESNLSLDSLLSGAENNNMNSDWSNSGSSSVQTSDLDWSNSSNNATNWSNSSNNASIESSGLDWSNSQTNSSSNLDWLDSSSSTTSQSNLDWQNSLGSQSSTLTTQNLGETTTTNQYVNSQIYYDKPQITQTQQLITKPMIQKKIISQPIITQKIVQQPIIKQRILQTPIIRQKVVKRPVYTETQNLQPIVDTQTTTRTVPINVPGKTTIRETYYQPTVLTKDVRLQLNRGQTQVNDMPVQTRPTQYSEEIVNKVVQAPAREVYTQPIYQKQIVNNTERVNFVKSNPVYMSNAPIYREPVLQERTRFETIQRPGREIYNNTYIQPIVQRENVNVRFNRLPDRTINMESVVAPAQYNTTTRTETVQVPGNQIITQPVYQRYIHQRNIHHVQQPVVQRVAVHRPYPVPTPVIKRVPIIRRIPVPVFRRRNQGTKIINLNKVTINGGRSSNDWRSSDDDQWNDSQSDEWDQNQSGEWNHDYHGWVSSRNNSNNWYSSQVARMSPFSYRNSSSRNNQGLGYGMYNNYSRYQRDGADLMFGRSNSNRYNMRENYGHQNYWQNNNNYGHGFVGTFY